MLFRICNLYLCAVVSNFLRRLAWKVWDAYQAGQARLSLTFSPAKPYPATPNRVLLICTGLMGDSIMATPFLKQFRKAFSTARIGMLSRPIHRDLFGPLKLIDAYFFHPDGLPLPTSRTKLQAWQHIYRQVRDFDADVGIVLLGGEWLPLLARLRVPLRIDSERSRFPALCTHRYPFPNVRYLSPQTFLGVLPLLGIEPAYEELPSLQADPEEVARMRQHLHAQGIQRFWVLNPFAATANRTFSREKLYQLVQSLRSLSFPLILVGPPEARMDLSEFPEFVHNWIGKTSVSELMALVALSEGVITVDTGVLHIAGAMQKPTVGLFRAIRPEYAHLYPTVLPVFWEKGSACLPDCRWDSWYGCAEVPCRQLEEIAPETVLQAVQKLST